MIWEFGVVILLGGGMLVARELLRIEWAAKQHVAAVKAKRAYILSRAEEGEKEWTVDGERYRISGGRLRIANLETKMWEPVE